jgi:hypothetical protein
MISCQSSKSDGCIFPPPFRSSSVTLPHPKINYLIRKSPPGRRSSPGGARASNSWNSGGSILPDARNPGNWGKPKAGGGEAPRRVSRAGEGTSSAPASEYDRIVIGRLGSRLLSSVRELRLKSPETSEPTEEELRRQRLRAAAAENGSIERCWAGWRGEYCRRELKSKRVSNYLELRWRSWKSREGQYVKTIHSGAPCKSKGRRLKKELSCGLEVPQTT